MEHVPENMQIEINAPKICSKCHTTYYGLHCYICPPPVDKQLLKQLSKGRRGRAVGVFLCLVGVMMFFGGMAEVDYVDRYTDGVGWHKHPYGAKAGTGNGVVMLVGIFLFVAGWKGNNAR